MNGPWVVLVVGVPRSGTSWVGRVLGSTPGAVYLGEPDNHEHSPFALRAKLGLPGVFYPDLRPDTDAPVYERLWAEALASPAGRVDSLSERARRALTQRLLRQAKSDAVLRAIAQPRQASLPLRVAARLAVPDRPPLHDGMLVVKSVSTQLALEWIAVRFPVSVVLILRHPLNVVSSWKEMGWLEGPNGVLSELGLSSTAALERRYGVPALSDASPIAEAAQLVGLLTSALIEAAGRHPQWSVVAHEALCEQPHEAFRAVAASAGLAWDDGVDRLLDALNRPGTGYETARVSEGLDDIWRARLTPAEVEAVNAVLDRFGSDWTAPAPRSR